jgi:predicted acetyltransferase
MYRVIDISRLFGVLKDHDFGGQTLRVKMTITDSFLPENAGNWVIHAEKGRVKLKSSRADADVEIKLDIAEFSSMIMGVISFSDLYRMGLADISDTGQVGAVDRLLFFGRKPICTAQF